RDLHGEEVGETAARAVAEDRAGGVVEHEVLAAVDVRSDGQHLEADVLEVRPRLEHRARDRHERELQDRHAVRQHEEHEELGQLGVGGLEAPPPCRDPGDHARPPLVVVKWRREAFSALLPRKNARTTWPSPRKVRPFASVRTPRTSSSVASPPDILAMARKGMLSRKSALMSADPFVSAAARRPSGIRKI